MCPCLNVVSHFSGNQSLLFLFPKAPPKDRAAKKAPVRSCLPDSIGHWVNSSSIQQDSTADGSISPESGTSWLTLRAAVVSLLLGLLPVILEPLQSTVQGLDLGSLDSCRHLGTVFSTIWGGFATLKPPAGVVNTT